MSSELAARSPQPGRGQRSAESVTAPAAVIGGAGRRLFALLSWPWSCAPLGVRRCAIAAAGVAVAAGVGLTTAANPGAAPAGAAVALRVGVISAWIAAGLYGHTSRIQARMGSLLIATGFVSSLWLLNGSGDQLLFSLGLLVAGLMPGLFAFLILAQPTGLLHSRVEARFIWFTGGLAGILWLAGALSVAAPPLRTPLMACGHGCPHNVFSLGSAQAPGAVLQASLELVWGALAVGAPVLLIRRARASSAPVRRSLAPVAVVAAVIAVVSVAYLAAGGSDSRTRDLLGGIYAASLLALPLAVIAGLARERMFMAQRLAEFVSQLARMPRAAPEALMATALRDPSLRIAYRRPGRDTYVDADGRPVSEHRGDQAVAWIERDRQRVAAVMYNAELVDCERFVQAAGAAAMIRLEREQLESDLRATNADLAASRVRLMESVHAERRRLERDLHDGIQQHIVGLRIKLELASEAISRDPVDGQRIVASIGRQMDDVLSDLRSLARGIYPSLLSDSGLAEALRSAARSSPVPAEVRGGQVGRFAEEVEVAVYFCCLEALQNVAKHARGNVTATVTLEQRQGRLCFEVRDTGIGFEPASVSAGRGLVNMRDRIEAVGGCVHVSSRLGHGTAVSGSVPIA